MVGWGGMGWGQDSSKGSRSNETFPPALPVHRSVATDVHLVVLIVGVIDDDDGDDEVDDDGDSDDDDE